MNILIRVSSFLLVALLSSMHIGANDNLTIGRLFSGKELDARKITSFCMDADGFLWIGTDNGLLRFDGVHYYSYRHEAQDRTSISDNRIIGVIRDKRNSIWVATANGLNRYIEESNSFERIGIKDFGENGFIISMTSDESGNVVFVVSGVGIFSVSEDKIGEIDAVEIISSDIVKNANCIHSSTDGYLYAGTDEGYVCVLQPEGEWKIVACLNSGIDEMVDESELSILISTIDGLYRMNKVSGHVKRLDIPADVCITSLSQPNGGKTYIATDGAGLLAIDRESNSVEKCRLFYSPFIDVTKSKIGVVYISPNGDIWAACDLLGILLFPHYAIPFVYRRLDFLSPDFGLPISSMDMWNKNVIVGNNEGRIIVVSEEGQIFRNFHIPDGKTVSSISVYDDRALFGVVGSGVWEADLITGNLRKILGFSGKTLSIVTCLGHDGKLYIGIYGKGILRYDSITGQKEWLNHTIEGKEMLRPFFTSIKPVGNLLWIGFYGGLACYNTTTGNFEDIDQSPYFTGVTYSVVTENDGSILVASSNGLIRHNVAENKIIKISTFEGLADNDVRSVVLDGSGNIWIGTMNGISRADHELRLIETYRGGYGIEELSFERMFYTIDDNKIMASGRMGISYIKPDAFKSPVFDSSLKCTAIFIKGKAINPSTEIGNVKVIEGPSTSPTILNLPSDENSISIRISTMDFRDCSNLSYFWRISDNENWEMLPPDTDMIHLSSLAPGSYELEYKAVDSGVESPVSVLRINVAYPWYLTWQAKTTYIFILIVLMILIFLTVRKNHKERLIERKMQLIIDVYHDMRSPLTLILHPLESLLNEELRSDIRNKIRVVYRNAHRISHLANQILEIKKKENGKIKLACRQTDLSCFIGDLVEMLQPQASDKGISLYLHLNEKNTLVWIDRSVLDRVLVNIISNAIKYTPENGMIDVIVGFDVDRKLGDCVMIQVKDTGIGLGDYSADLFDRYRRFPNGEEYTEDGYGLGMDICRRYVSLHHGKIKAENRKDGVEGSVFSIIIPTDKEIYDTHEFIDDEATLHSTEMMETGDLDSLSYYDERPESNESSSLIYESSRVLLVDDDQLLRDAVGSYLKTFFKVSTAQDGNEGYRLAQELIPDVIVTDVKMPNSDGLQMLSSLKQNSETAHIPVIILSQMNELSDRLSGWRGGAEAYLGKPFEFNELKIIISKLIDSRSVLRDKYKRTLEIESNPEDQIKELKKDDQVFIERLKAIINDKVDKEDVNVEWLAKEVGISRSQLHRKLKDQIGITPSDLIRNVRLKRAAELLQKGDLDITQVAYSLGFSSLSQFSTTFKRFMGCAPSEYRSRHSE